jgi:tryptophanyl-tRNA synthetase
MKRTRESQSKSEQVESCENHGLQSDDTSLTISHENEQKHEVVFLLKCSKTFSQLNSITGF